MGPIRAVIHVMANPFKFSGRASFSEFWWFTGLTVILPWLIFTKISFGMIWQVEPVALGEMIEQLLAAMTTVFSGMAVFGWSVGVALGLAVLYLWHYIAWFAVGVRRMHDTGRSAILYTTVYLLPPFLVFYLFANFAYLTVIDDPAVAETVAKQLAPFAILVIPVSIGLGLLVLWFWIVMLFPGDPTSNRFGPKPGADKEDASDRVSVMIPGAAPEPEIAGLSAADLRELRQARMEQVQRF